MQFEEANKLEEEWALRGNPPCEHEYLSKEYHFGMDSGDYRCTTCGATFTGAEYRKWRAGEAPRSLPPEAQPPAGR